MKCNAMFMLLETALNKEKTKNNHFLTFIDIDTGESFRTYVDGSIALTYKKFKKWEITLSISLSEYNGRPQLNTRILTLIPLSDDFGEENPLQSVKPALFAK